MRSAELKLQRVRQGSTVDVAITPLTFEQMAFVGSMDMNEADEEFAGGSMKALSDRLAPTFHRSNHHPFLITAGAQTAGFFMLREGEAAPSWLAPDAMSLHNFRIAGPMRGNGYGAAALVLAARWITRHRPTLKRLMLSVNVENHHARIFYLRCGLTDAGHVVAGRRGTESVFVGKIAALARWRASNDSLHAARPPRRE